MDEEDLTTPFDVLLLDTPVHDAEELIEEVIDEHEALTESFAQVDADELPG